MLGACGDAGLQGTAVHLTPPNATRRQLSRLKQARGAKNRNRLTADGRGRACGAKEWRAWSLGFLVLPQAHCFTGRSNYDERRDRWSGLSPGQLPLLRVRPGGMTRPRAVGDPIKPEAASKGPSSTSKGGEDQCTFPQDGENDPQARIGVRARHFFLHTVRSALVPLVACGLGSSSAARRGGVHNVPHIKIRAATRSGGLLSSGSGAAHHPRQNLTKPPPNRVVGAAISGVPPPNGELRRHTPVARSKCVLPSPATAGGLWGAKDSISAGVSESGVIRAAAED